MTDIKKLSDIDEITAASSTDLMHVATDLGGGSYLSKKITVANIKSDVLLLDQTTPQTVSGGMPLFDDGIQTGGSGEGMSTIAGGLTVNNVQGGTDNDDFVVHTTNTLNALVVDASEDKIRALEDIQIESDAKSLLLGSDHDMSVKYDGTEGVIDAGLVNPSDVRIKCGTEKTIVLDEVVWDDMRITPGSFDRPGVGDPTIVAYNVNGGGISTYFHILTKQGKIFMFMFIGHLEQEASRKMGILLGGKYNTRGQILMEHFQLCW